MPAVSLGVIVAVAQNGVLGRDNALPWHLPEDLAYFKRRTLGKPVVMGRRTWESIGRPLPGRRNIVISRSPAFTAEGAEVVVSLAVALDLARAHAAAEGVAEVMVIGGAAVYAQAIPLADTLYVTEVHAEVDGDAYLPPIDWSAWQEQHREFCSAHKNDSFDFSFVTYRRAGVN
ncbi:MAG: dihydrofolate reductase [Parahaliea sp.]